MEEERRPEMIWLAAGLTAGAVFGGLVFLATLIRKASFEVVAGGAVAAFGFARGGEEAGPVDPYADNEDLQEAERRARDGEVD